MPNINGLPLPTLSVSDAENFAAFLARSKFPPEALLELVVYLGREKAKADVLDEAIARARARLMEYFEKLAPEHRETVSTPAGTVSYSKGTEKHSLRDRDATVEGLTPEALRASYVPDMKVLKAILKPADYERFVKVEPGRGASIIVKDTKGPYDEF